MRTPFPELFLNLFNIDIKSSKKGIIVVGQGVLIIK